MIQKYPKKLLTLREKGLDFFRNYSVPRWMVFILDNTAVLILFPFAYLLLYTFDFSLLNPDTILYQTVIVTIVYAVFSLKFRSYAELIRHTTLMDIFHVFMVTTSASLTIITISLLSYSFGLHDHLLIPIHIVVIHYVLTTVLLFGVRISIKIMFRFVSKKAENKLNVIIYGAGEIGFVVKRVVMSDPKYGFNVVGFIDSNPKYLGKMINGIQVFKDSILSPEFISKKEVQSLILADEQITIEEKSDLIRRAMNLGLEVLETPEVDKWLNGQMNSLKFQKVKIEDLLGRKPIKLNQRRIMRGLNNKTILITGAAGSIGSGITRQLARFDFKLVILVDQAETPLFFLGNELRKKFRDINFQIVVADVTNLTKMDLIFQQYKPKIIFHAAAYKHVPLMEGNPHEAVRVNVGGTKVITSLAVKYKAEKFVMISTDKSVNPTNIMGASKRICEKLVQSVSKKEGGDTQFIITRFGNVLGSNGSVIPVFSQQIREGGPVTVTHPEIYRYFMTIPEACQLVLEAGFMGKGGEIFVFDMGEPIKIADLAKNMILLSGYIPGIDIEIKYTGLRPGEKLYEELLTDKEKTIATHHSKIKKARVELIDEITFLGLIDQLINNIYSLSKTDLIKIIKKMVPEYKNKQPKKFDTKALN